MRFKAMRLLGVPKQKQNAVNAAYSVDDLTLTGNKFLDSLPEPTRAKLQPQLQHHFVKTGLVVAEPSEPCTDIFFPLHSVISTVTIMEDGSAVEVGLVGNEGFSPLQVAFGNLASRHSTMVQVPNSALCMNAKVFMSVYRTEAKLRDQCIQFAEYSFAAATQFVACNGVHGVEQRYARWILMAADRVGAETFYLTQEYSAMMLSVRRATVNEVASRLNRLGLISYKRGNVVLMDRAGLQDAACECYAAVNHDLQRLMGYGFEHVDL